jgi:putative DNA primase/helicase
MVTKIRHVNGNAVGVHVVYLESDGRKRIALESPKIVLGAPARCAVWPDRIAAHMGLAEGVETALAAERLFGLPVIAGLTAGNLPKVDLPASVRELTIFADNDDSGAGVKAARAALARFARLGLTVHTIMPTTLGYDAADELLEASRE